MCVTLLIVDPRREDLSIAEDSKLAQTVEQGYVAYLAWYAHRQLARLSHLGAVRKFAMGIRDLLETA